MTSIDPRTPLDLDKVRARARLAYERGRLQRALLGVAPLGAAVALACCFATRPGSAFTFGVLALALGVFMLWYGRDPQRSFVWGAVAGVVPLVLALVANHVHTCGPSGCATWCVPACSVGGLVAGAVVAYPGVRQRAGVWFWVFASALALLVGAMGCACVGAAGIVGLVVGFGIGLVPGVITRVPRRER